MCSLLQLLLRKERAEIRPNQVENTSQKRETAIIKKYIHGCTTCTLFFFYRSPLVPCPVHTTFQRRKEIEKGKNYLPAIQLVLLGLILFEHFLKDLFQAVGIRFQGRKDIFDCSFDENPVYHAKTFPILGERLKGFDDQPSKSHMCTHQ